MRVLVTGADGFVGSHLVPLLRERGHEVLATVRPGFERREGVALLRDSKLLRLELESAESVRAVAGEDPEGVVHLAAVASGADAQRDPAQAWRVNTLGTAMLAEALAHSGGGKAGTTFLLVSTAEVYGDGPPTPRVESDPPRPCSPYAASKLGAEIASQEVHRRTGLRVVVARAFPHLGAGQDDRFVVPAFARRIIEAKRRGETEVRVGNLEPIRDYLHVSDVAAAYCELLEKGEPGEVYNVASGEGIGLGDLLELLADIVGHAVTPRQDPDLMRPADISYLVGDSTKLRRRTGWRPRVSLHQALAEVVGAQTD